MKFPDIPISEEAERAILSMPDKAQSQVHGIRDVLKVMNQVDSNEDRNYPTVKVKSLAHDSKDANETQAARNQAHHEHRKIYIDMGAMPGVLSPNDERELNMTLGRHRRQICKVWQNRRRNKEAKTTLNLH